MYETPCKGLVNFMLPVCISDVILTFYFDNIMQLYMCILLYLVWADQTVQPPFYNCHIVRSW